MIYDYFMPREIKLPAKFQPFQRIWKNIKLFVDEDVAIKIGLSVKNDSKNFGIANPLQDSISSSSL